MTGEQKVTVLYDIFISQKYQKTLRRLFCNSAHIKYDFFWSQSPLLYAFAQRKYLIIASCFKIIVRGRGVFLMFYRYSQFFFGGAIAYH